MKFKKMFVLAAALSFLGCGDDEEFVGFFPQPNNPGQISPSPTVTPPASLPEVPVPANTTLVGLNATGTGLVRFNSSTPGSVTAVPVTGLLAGQTLVGIDFRPQNRLLYGLGRDAGTNAMQLYSINSLTGVATPVGATGAFVAADGATAVPVTGTAFGFDFNPAVDRIRVVSNSGQNFRMNPNTGAFVDGDGGAPAPVAGLQMDGAVNGGTTTLDGAAYTNNLPNNGGTTTLYTLDSATDSLYIQNPPNAGTQTLPVLVTAGGNRLDFGAANGFDYPPRVSDAGNNEVAQGVAFAVLDVGGTSSLFSIDVVTGNTRNLGVVGGTGPLRGLAVEGFLPGQPVVGLGAGGATLVRFNSTTPGTTNTVNVSGITAGETLVGIDFRSTTGELIGFGVNDGADTGTLYRVDPQTGGATVLVPGSAGSIAFVSGGVATDLPPAASGYGFDFNPTVDRIRVVTGTGLNLRLNPVTGGAVDGDPGTAGVNPDGAINGAAGASGAAYTNSVAGATVTTLYTLDSASDSLFIQNPPNNGTQSVPLAVTLNGAALNFTAVNGFDINRGVSVAASNSPATGSAIAGLTVGGVAGIYSIDLSNGNATFLGAAGAALTGLAVGN